MDLGLSDRVYIVTGGSRGLGLAAAEALIADVPAKCVRLALAPPEGVAAGVVPMEVLPVDEGQPTLATLISTGKRA